MSPEVSLYLGPLIASVMWQPPESLAERRVWTKQQAALQDRIRTEGAGVEHVADLPEWIREINPGYTWRFMEQWAAQHDPQKRSN